MTNRTRTEVVLLGLTLLLAGCRGSGSPSTLSGPSPVPQTVSPPTPSAPDISGYVEDTAFRPLGGARVEVVDGPQAGMSTTVDANGAFSLSGTFDSATRFRATKDGYVTATQTWNCSVGVCPGDNNVRPWLGFYLAMLVPPVDIAGDYTLTFIADSACSGLPNEVRTRTYAATITPGSNSNRPANTFFNVAVTGASFLKHYDSFEIGVAGDFLTLAFGGDGPRLVEEVAPNTYLAFDGWAGTSVGTSAVSTISTSFEGVIDYCVLKFEAGSYYQCLPSQAVAHAQCQSTNHRLILTRK